MIKILYIGNQLSKHGFTPTSIETLGVRLADHFQLYFASSKKNLIHRFLDMIFTFLKLKKDIDYVIIDTYSTYSFYYSLVISQLARVFGVKYIPILRGGALPARLDSSPILSDKLFKYSYCNVSPSEYLHSEFKQRGYSTLLIPNFINLAEYPFKLREKILPRLLWVRSFDQTYNPQMAIHVLAKLNKFENASLCMVGPDKDGSLELCQKLAIELNIADKIKFTGKLSKAEWISLSKNYDIFINTTNFDNTPISVIEAMALGLPIVTTNVGGIPFLLKDQEEALLVDPKNINSMVGSIKRLLEESELTLTLSQNARYKAANFDWAIIKQEWIDLLK